MSVCDATIVPQRQRNVLTCFNEKVQIKNVKMETLSICPPACPAPILEIVANTNLTYNFVMAALNSSHKLYGSCI